MSKSTNGSTRNRQQVNGETLRTAVGWIVDEGIFARLKLHGNTKWLVADLVVLAVLWVWSDHACLTGAFTEAHCWSVKMLGRAAVGSYQGLTGALVTWTGALLPLLWGRLHNRMEQCAGRHWRVGLWLALAVDGSRVTTPRSEANEKAFCAKNYGRGQTAKYRKKKNKNMRHRKKAKPQPVKPQMWITLLWHMGMRLPWCWKIGPSDSSERDHFREMLREHPFPENTLFCGDAGFTGYDLWKTILDQGYNFLIRVGANVTLLRRLGYVREREGLVYFWPDQAAKKNQPPLVLRLFHFQVGRCQMYLVTNVLDQKRLSDAEASRLYRLRWGVELQFRALKQTFHRRKLRSKTPERAKVELDWSLIGLWMIQLLAVKEHIKIGEPPEHSSVSLAIGVIRQMFLGWSDLPARGRDLFSQLQAATTDTYRRKRSKEARYRPNYKDKPSAGKPKILLATRKHTVALTLYHNHVTQAV
jgi:hypothetical protein